MAGSILIGSSRRDEIPLVSHLVEVYKPFVLPLSHGLETHTHVYI